MPTNNRCHDKKLLDFPLLVFQISSFLLELQLAL
jgi:hypothetical protein